MTTDPAAKRLATSLRRLSSAMRLPPQPAPEDPQATMPPIEQWQYKVNRRLDALERRHDATSRRQTLLILTTIVAEIGLEILKHR